MALTTEDQLAIQQLGAAYCHLIDSGRGEEWADLFTPDGVFEIVDLMTTEGREALVGNANVFPEMMPGVRHIVHNMWVNEGDTADTATMHAYLSNVRAGDETQWVQTGIYNDDLVRTADGWRFARRTLTLDGPLF
jgi:3-phenylpropionate/cinnamic acid dioxygenase small subunit